MRVVELTIPTNKIKEGKTQGSKVGHYERTNISPWKYENIYSAIQKSPPHSYRWNRFF